MAHHNSTPQSVLRAPRRTVVRQFIPTGATRQERRHGVYLGGLEPIVAAAYLKSLAGRNDTAVRTVPRRGRKVRRGRS